MSKIRAALDRAETEVSRLELTVAKWQQDAAEKQQKLEYLEATAGEVVLADETGTAARELAVNAQELRFSIDGARAAAAAAQAKLRDARWDLALAQAAELRDRASALRAEAQRRQARVDELVAALVEFEGGDWRPWQPSRDDVVQAGAAGLALAARKTPPMFAEADRLDRQAALLEGQVEAERRQTGQAAPHARILWDGRHDRGRWTATVTAGLGDGSGSLPFEVLKNGQRVHAVVLPDGQLRGLRKAVEGFHGDTVEVRAGGTVLASQKITVPDGEVNLSHPDSVALNALERGSRQ